MNSPLKVGITGGIGAGKTFVCRVLEKMGYPVFYSDKEAKELMNAHPGIVEEIIALVGEQAYEDGELNRPFLAEKAFENKDLLSRINAIVHPRVREAFADFAEQNAGLKGIVFNEAAILFETGAYKTFDATVLITAPESIRLNRVVERDTIPESQVRSRMNNQWKDEEKAKLADFVIHNDGTTMLLPQIENMLIKLVEIGKRT